MNSVYIEITDACNLSCSFCPCGKDGVSRDFMDSALFERSIAESATVASSVYFHILGEPTLHPGFAHYLKKLESTSLKLNLTTNGTTIARTGKHLLASPALRQVNFSTHAYAELPEEQAKSHLQNVLDFCKMAKAVRPDLYINLRLWNVGDDSSDPWNHFFMDRLKATFTTAAELSLEHFCSRHKSFLLEGRIYLHQDSRFEWPKLGIPTETKIVAGTCRALDTHVGILHDGRVVACCLDHGGQITLGRIQEQGLAEILQSPMAKDLREGFAKHELRHPFCQSCTFCKRFGK